MLVFYVFQQSQIQGAFLGETELETAKRESWESKGRRDINKVGDKNRRKQKSYDFERDF